MRIQIDGGVPLQTPREVRCEPQAGLGRDRRRILDLGTAAAVVRARVDVHLLLVSAQVEVLVARVVEVVQVGRVGYADPGVAQLVVVLAGGVDVLVQRDVFDAAGGRGFLLPAFRDRGDVFGALALIGRWKITQGSV